MLCLHPEASSALQLSKDLHKLEQRLYTKHGIELVFVDAPLLDVQLGQSVGDDGGGINAIEPRTGDDGNEEFISRRWYVKEDARTTALEEGLETVQRTTVRWSGLDASLLHLQQIWKRGGANVSKNTPGDFECFPFQGVLGFGQGANVAALLPLLSTTQTEDKDDAPPLFQGLQFVALVGGADIMDYQPADNTREEIRIDSEDLYVGSDGLASLHILLGADRQTCRSGENLARKYGPKAQVHRVPQSNSTCNATLCNILGKFLVSRKNELRQDPKAMELLSLQTRLLDVEHMATLALSNQIQQKPPKALMAVIGPAAVSEKKDGKRHDADGRDTDKENNDQPVAKVVDRAVGAWAGARRRGFGEEGGGAPCPQNFLLKEEERK